MSSLQSTNHSHPLSLFDPPASTRNPRRRATAGGALSPDAGTTNTVTNYFTLKLQSEERAAGILNGVSERRTDADRWSVDGSVRGYGSRTKHRGKLEFPSVTHEEHVKPETSSLGALWRPTLDVPDPSVTPTPAGSSSTVPVTDTLASYPHYLPADAVEAVLSTKWHRSSEEEIQTALTTISAMDPLPELSPHPSHGPLRALSSALEDIGRRHAQLLQRHSQLERKEKERRQRGEQFVRDTPAPEQEIVRQIMEILYPDEETISKAGSARVESPVRLYLIFLLGSE